MLTIFFIEARLPWDGAAGSSQQCGVLRRHVPAVPVPAPERDRDAELRLSHDEIRRLAAMAERERISRDLHDLLGHTLSLVAIKSDLAGKLLDRDPGSARGEIHDYSASHAMPSAQYGRAVTGIRAADFTAELASSHLLMESSGVRLSHGAMS